jgi:plastocyanin
VTVETGGTVTWANDDTAPHTASSDEEAVAEFDTGALDQGDSKKVTLDEPGTYAYHCDFHATMNGTVEVVE